MSNACVKSRVTSLAFNLFNVLSIYILILKTYLLVTMLTLRDKITIFYMLLMTRASNLILIVSFYNSLYIKSFIIFFYVFETNIINLLNASSIALFVAKLNFIIIL